MYILIVDDDAMVLEVLRRELRMLGVTAETAGTLADAYHCLSSEAFDAVVLDVNLPDGSGLELLASLRQHDALTPVLMLTANDAIESRVAGLDAGADDYLGKPFRVPELAARLRALGRRRSRGEMVLARGGIVLELAHLSANVDGRRIALSPREASLLDTLMRWPGTIQSKRDLEARIYGWQEDIESNTIEVHVHNLRTKIGRHRIETVRGAGYRLRIAG